MNDVLDAWSEHIYWNYDDPRRMEERLNGRALTAPNGDSSEYSIGGLPPSATLSLVIWNAAGDGLVGSPTAVAADAAGVASIAVPQHAVFVLTTLRL